MTLGRNIIANYLGQVWMSLLGFIVTPLLIFYLGIEGYGLIGAFNILSAILVIFELGMVPALNREMARYSAGACNSQAICDLLVSLEVLIGGLAIVIAVFIGCISDFLGYHWLNIVNLRHDDVVAAIILMGVAAALKYAEGLYQAALMGLQKQVLLNKYTTIFSTVRSLGAVAVVVWISPTVIYYFLWQVLISFISLWTFHSIVHKQLPSPTTVGRPSIGALKSVWGVARGVFLTSILSLLLMYVDKLLLSHLLDLKTFGIYMVAASLPNLLYQLVNPVAQGFYPKFSQLVAHGTPDQLNNAYHLASQLLTVMLVPAALLLIFFSNEFLFLWTRNASLASDAALIVSVLSFGTMCNGLLNIPHILQLAYGWTEQAVRVNTVAILFVVPAIFWSVPLYGPLGAACVWVILNIGYYMIAIPLMHTRLLPTEKWKWYRNDILIPMMYAALVTIVAYLLHPMGLSIMAECIWLLISGVIAFICTILSASCLRQQIVNWVR